MGIKDWMWSVHHRKNNSRPQPAATTTWDLDQSKHYIKRTCNISMILYMIYICLIKTNDTIIHTMDWITCYIYTHTHFFDDGDRLISLNRSQDPWPSRSRIRDPSSITGGTLGSLEGWLGVCDQSCHIQTSNSQALKTTVLLTGGLCSKLFGIGLMGYLAFQSMQAGRSQVPWFDDQSHWFRASSWDRKTFSKLKLGLLQDSYSTEVTAVTWNF